MNEVQHTMTGLEARFEDEMAAVIPGWKSDEIADSQPAMAEPTPENERDHAVETAMMLGV